MPQPQTTDLLTNARGFHSFVHPAALAVSVEQRELGPTWKAGEHSGPTHSFRVGSEAAACCDFTPGLAPCSAGALEPCTGPHSTSGSESFNYGEGKRAESAVGTGSVSRKGLEKETKVLISRSAGD